MANVLVCCGGTGAHVALSFMRMHALGHPLGFFRHEAKDATLELPHFCLVDQDSSDAAPGDDETAWQKLGAIIKGHPSRHQWGDRPGQQRPPTRGTVTPLPLGPRKDWFDAPLDQLGAQFDGSDYLDLVASSRQQGIRYSHGMMGSPAIGSLLFQLKEYDRYRSGSHSFNHDRDFDRILDQTGRIAVVGSGVGGTGSSVAPTLARMLDDRGEADVMAIMVLQWFELKHPAAADSETIHATARRNRDMRENASSGLQFYGRKLARNVPTVPVGVPEEGLIRRPYAGDNQQPLHEVYAHAVAGLCCLLHYSARRPFSPGLYYMGAADPSELGGGTMVPGGAAQPGRTLQAIANQGEVLEKTARVLGRVLAKHPKPGRYSPAICAEVAKATKHAGSVGQQLVKLAGEYRQHLDWLYNVLGVKPEPLNGMTLEKHVRGRLKASPLPLTPKTPVENLAGELFQWTADWVRDRAAGDLRLRPDPASGSGAYWPPLVRQGLAVSGGEPGELIKLPRQNVDATLDSFVDARQISQNGWPDPFASASHFHNAVDRTDEVAMRKLELVMAGLIEERLEIEEIGRGTVDGVHVDRIVDDAREEAGRDLARYRVVMKGGDGEVLAFSSPRTLFCPAPGVSDAAWGRLWASLTGFDAKTWKPHTVESWEAQEWGSAAGGVRKIVGWIRACRRRVASDDPPPAWTRVFPALRDARPRAFGGRTTLTIDWGEDGQRVPVYLPTATSGDFSPTDGDEASTEGADAFLREHGTISESGDMLFEVVDDLRLPIDQEARSGRPSAPTRQVRAIWKEHLDRLQEQGVIVAFGDDRDQRHVYVVEHDERGRRCILLEETLMLDRESIRVTNIVPLRQDSAPDDAAPGGVMGRLDALRRRAQQLLPGRLSGISAAAETLYPDLPLRSDYVDLVDPARWSGDRQPTVHPGGDKAEWRLPLRGRGKTKDLMIAVSLPAGKQHTAHWMVWPGFRTALREGAGGWRAYYVYEQCSHPRVGLDVLYRDSGDDRAVFRRRNRGDQRPSYPVSYDARRREHVGGPPIAVSLRDHERNEEHGVYMVPLKPVDPLLASASVGIDFGTSHSSAAAKVGGSDASLELLLGSEMGDGGSPALSHHISHDWEHVGASDKGGFFSQSAWMPTYVGKATPSLANLVPTELLTHEPVHKMSKAVDRWVPLQDYVIPPTGISRRDFHAYVIANFKWDTLSAFHGREKELRRNYLDHLIELAAAEVIERYGAPEQGIHFTFTYPLRTPRDEVESYQDLLRDVMGRGSSSLGTGLSLTDGNGLFNESHAASVGLEAFPEVCVVGDLGGGTLDIFISAEGKPGLEFAEVVDSVKIGGNLLLRVLGNELSGKMPHGWATDGEELAAQLAAWMRTMGSPKLFGSASKGVPVHEALKLPGFRNAKQKRPGREIIHRYFHLVGEYVSRSVAAYLGTHWYGKAPIEHREQLSLQLYLRGNGWKLWPGDEDFPGIEAAVARRVSSRIGKLWHLFHLDGSPPVASRPAQCEPGGGGGHPKLDVVRNVVGESRPDVRDDWLSYTMVEVRVLGPRGEKVVPWHARTPFHTGGVDAKAQVDEVRPPIPLSQSLVRPFSVDDLGQQGHLAVNRKLKDADHGGPDSLDLLAPVGAFVWEEAFKLLGKGDGKGSQR